LAAVDQIAGMFDSHVTGVFFNVMPLAAGIGNAGGQSAQLLETTRKAGDAIETAAFEQLKRLRRSTYFRRFDVIDNEDLIGSALPLARTADTFVAFWPNGQTNEPQGLIENLLYGAGRHVLLVPPKQPIIMPFDTITVAWNGSREAARAVAESLPYLQRADKVGVLVVEESEHPTEADALMGNDAVQHLRHHGVNAVKCRSFAIEDEVAETLIAECRSFGAKLLVIGSYGHSLLRELLPGSTTSRLLRSASIPLLVAH
jgi:nucleotide-binding universal stress UspA family protein